MRLGIIEGKSKFILRFLSLLFLIGFIWFFFREENLVVKNFKIEYIIFNLCLAVVVLFTYFLMRKIDKIFYNILIIIILSLAFFVVPVKRELSLCGDAIEWIQFADTKIMTASEMLPHLVRYCLIHILKPLGFSVREGFEFTSSLFGLISLFSFFFLSRTLYQDKELSVFFFCGTLTFAVQGFYFRYPENPFFAIPFLVFALKFSIESFTKEGRNYFISVLLYSFFLSFSIITHGFSWFSLPFFLVLPFLKEQKIKKSILIALFTFAILIMTIFFTILILRSFSFLIYPHHAVVLMGRAYPFVDFLGMSKYYSLKIELFSDTHLSGVILSIFLSFPSILFIIPLNFLKIEIRKSDLTILILALCQLIFIFLWNPDLGIWKDLDLFLSPSTFISLVYLNIITNLTKSKNNLHMLFLLFFSIFSGIPYLLIRV